MKVSALWSYNSLTFDLHIRFSFPLFTFSVLYFLLFWIALSTFSHEKHLRTVPKHFCLKYQYDFFLFIYAKIMQPSVMCWMSNPLQASPKRSEKTLSFQCTPAVLYCFIVAVIKPVVLIGIRLNSCEWGGGIKQTDNFGSGLLVVRLFINRLLCLEVV